MNNKKYHTVGTTPKFNRKIVDKIDTPNTHIYTWKNYSDAKLVLSAQTFNSIPIVMGHGEIICVLFFIVTSTVVQLYHEIICLNWSQSPTGKGNINICWLSCSDPLVFYLSTILFIYLAFKYLAVIVSDDG